MTAMIDIWIKSQIAKIQPTRMGIQIYSYIHAK